MRSRFLILGIIVLSIIGIILSVFLAKRQQDIRQRATGEAVSLILAPATLTKNVGETFDITLSVGASGNNITGVDIPLQFDSAILELTDVTSSNTMNTELLKSINNTNGTFRYVAVNTQNTTLTGSVPIATLRFRTKAPGTAVTLFQDTSQVVALGHTGLLSMGNNENGSYTVVSTPTSTPQPTNEPTNTPTQNYISNGCFENQLSNWTCNPSSDSNGNCIVESSDKFEGNNSAKVIYQTIGIGRALLQSGISIPANQPLCISARVKKLGFGTTGIVIYQDGVIDYSNKIFIGTPDWQNTTDWQLIRQTITPSWPKIQIGPLVQGNSAALFDIVTLTPGTCESSAPFSSCILQTNTPTPVPTNTPVPTPLPTNQPTNIPPSPTVEKPTPTSGTQPTPTPTKQDGDINGDGNVRLDDFTIWKIDFLLELSGQTTNGHSDLNNDGQTNLLDFTIWKIGFLRYLNL